MEKLPGGVVHTGCYYCSQNGGGSLHANVLANVSSVGYNVTVSADVSVTDQEVRIPDCKSYISNMFFCDCQLWIGPLC